MLIVRSPLRVSLFGGGTDIPEFFEEKGGIFISFTLNKYIYLMAHPLVESNSILLKYSKTEKVSNALKIEHPVFREVLKQYEISSIDISVSSDIPSGTGLGSSSSFSVGLIHLIRVYKGLENSKYNLAKEACVTEIEKLKEPIGIQDQFASAFGGLNEFKVDKFGNVQIQSLLKSTDLAKLIERNCILVRVEGIRNAREILQEVDPLNRNQHKIYEIAKLVSNNYPKTAKEFGSLLNEVWMLKRSISSKISNSKIDNVYNDLIKMGIYGGKLLGAGASGYLFIVADEETVRYLINHPLYKTIVPRLDQEGSKVIYNSAHEFEN